MEEEFDLDRLAGRIPFKAQLPTPHQVAAALALLSLVGPAALGGMPVIPVTIQDEQRRQRDEIQQTSESTVGRYQTSAEAETGLALSQQRLAAVTREVDDLHTHDVSEQDVWHAADQVFSGNVEVKLSGRFRSAFNRVVRDNVDLYILRDNEEYERSQEG